MSWFDKTKANDRDVALKAVRRALEDASPDKDVALEAVNQNGRALEYASPEMQNDKDVALKAIGNDEDVTLEAIKNNVAALQYASPELQNDEDIKAIAESYEDFDDLGDDDPGDIGD